MLTNLQRLRECSKSKLNRQPSQQKTNQRHRWLYGNKDLEEIRLDVAFANGVWLYGTLVQLNSENTESSLFAVAL
jgi:hypothetical protein